MMGIRIIQITMLNDTSTLGKNAAKKEVKTRHLVQHQMNLDLVVVPRSGEMLRLFGRVSW